MFKKIIKYSLLLSLLTVFSAAAQQDTEIQRSESVVTIDGESFYVHTIAPGTTFYSLSKLYDISREDIRYYNPHTADGLKAGQVIKIPYKSQAAKPLTQRQMKRTFDTHTVNSGETVYSLLQRYNIPLSVLLEDNEGLDPTVLAIGQKLNIRKASQGEADTKEIKEEITAYKEALNSVLPGFEHHLVDRGETLYSLSRQNGVSEEIIKFHNPEIEKTGFNYGMIIRIPVKETQAAAENVQPDNAQGAAIATEVEKPQDTYFRGIKNINTDRPLNVVMILPLRGMNIDNGQNFADFYRGGLIALEELKRSGVSVKLDLFNCANSPEEVRGILRSPEAENADLIIGPVYQESFDEVARFAIPRGIVAVSPLALLQGNEYPNIFQVSPHSKTKSDKLREDINESNNVIVIRSGGEDTEFAGEIKDLIPSSAHNITYSKGMSSSSIERAMSKDRENVFVILSSDDATVGEILARLTSIKSNLTARSIMNPVIKVVGGSRWSRFRSKDQEHYFFPLGVRYIPTYHADRSNRSVTEFDARYLSIVGSLPSQIPPYAYRGYDVVKLFVGNMKTHGSGFIYHINNGELSLLGVPYRFEQIVPDGKYQNMEWPKVCYNNDYTITVE